jgi:CHAD domain-containing protein
MPYRLDLNESVPDGVRRIAREELESAAGSLAQAKAANRDEAIHEARKSLKKVRALLRLMRPEVEAIFRAENQRLRNAGRRLSRFRDAGVLIETFDDLRERYREDLGRRKLASIRRALVAAKRQQESRGVAGRLEGVSTTLRAAARRVDRWPLKAAGFEAIAPGLGKTFRQGRRRLATAREQGRAEDFHEWRKRVKDHWYHVRLLQDLKADELVEYEKTLHDLETWLGDDHNLVLLHDRLIARTWAKDRPQEVERCLGLIQRRQHELRAKALELGAHVYGVKRREFVEKIGRLWHDRQPQPVAASTPAVTAPHVPPASPHPRKAVRAAAGQSGRNPVHS